MNAISTPSCFRLRPKFQTSCVFSERSQQRRSSIKRETLVSCSSSEPVGTTLQASYRIRRASPKDIDPVATLCAEAFADSAEYIYPDALTKDEDALKFIQEKLYTGTYNEISSGLEKAFSRKAVKTAQARLDLKSRRAEAMRQELILLRDSGVDLKEQLSGEQVADMEERMRAAALRETTEQQQSQSKKVTGREFMCIVAEEKDSGTLIGSATLSLSVPDALLPAPMPTSKELKAYLSNMVVASGHRRKGVASSLLAQCQRVAALWSYDQLWLHVDIDNDAARQMYTAQGFDLVRADPWWFGIPRRNVMKKRISSRAN